MSETAQHRLVWYWCVGSLKQDQAWRSDRIFSMMKKEKDGSETECAVSLPTRKLCVKVKLHLSKRVN